MGSAGSARTQLQKHCETQMEDRLDVRRDVKGRIGAFGGKAGESSESQSE
jgi:hypothetical protein